MHEEAKKIVEKLNSAGYVAYFAGGWVRDYLLGVPSDDIDIATNALPETIQALFPKTVPIGLSFGIILVVVGEKQYEVATFRSDFSYKDGRRPSRIEYTNAAEDAKRRDFTINGMFFDPITEEVIDYVGGREDLKKKVIRAIGNPHLRFQEDRLRMVRAIRLSARLQFSIEEETQKAIRSHAKELLPAVAMERIWQEFAKMTAYPNVKKALKELYSFGLLPVIFPILKDTSPELLEKRIKYIDDYPPSAPTVAFVFSLFPSLPLEEKIILAQRCKLSNKEIAFISFWHEADIALGSPEEISKPKWVSLYAHPFFSIVLQIHAAHLPTNQREIFFKEHERRKKELAKAIERAKKQETVIRASDLLEEGISPGPLMGKLLSHAEELAIEKDLSEKNSLLSLLKQSELWPKKKS